MTCESIRQLLHAYLDDELDVVSAIEVEQHLLSCPECQKRLDAARAVSRGAGKASLYHPAPDALRRKLQAAFREEQGIAPASAPTPRLMIPWWRRPPLLSGIAALLVIAIGTAVLFHPAPSQNVQIAELIDSHLRSLEGNRLFDVESTDQHTVKPWFAGKLDFLPPVIDLSGEGFPLVGGRVDYLDGKKVAALIYRRNKHVINLFIWPGPESRATDARQGFNLVRFDCKGMNCWAISDLNAGELRQFADLFAAQNPSSTRS